MELFVQDHEAKLLKKICKRMEIVTPGIRLKGDSVGDQKRVIYS